MHIVMSNESVRLIPTVLDHAHALTDRLARLLKLYTRKAHNAYSDDVLESLVRLIPTVLDHAHALTDRLARLLKLYTRKAHICITSHS